MRFKYKLLQGTLIKRYKRFFVNISYKNKTLIAHCPNSGSMLGLLDDGNKVWFSKSDNPKRKLKYTLEMIEVKKRLVGVNTLMTNKIVHEALNENKIKDLKRFNIIKPEVKFSDKTRFDFMLTNDTNKSFLEVKNVTLLRNKNVGEFPDSVTSRGTKHLNELVLSIKKGFESFILYLIQMEGCNSFKIASDIDPIYKKAFNNAKKSGVKILCYDCKISPEEVKINKQIDLII